MPLPKWPESLPKRLRAEWTPGPQHERTNFGGPFEHAEEIFSGSNITLPFSLIATSDQVLTLRAWIKKYKAATNWVLMPADIGEGVQYYEARILRLDMPRNPISARHWTIPFDLEIRAKEDGSYWDLSDDDVEFLLAFEDVGAGVFADRLSRVVNTRMPKWLEE